MVQDEGRVVSDTSTHGRKLTSSMTDLDHTTNHLLISKQYILNAVPLAEMILIY